MSAFAIRDGVVSDLRSWSFTTLGWAQEYVGGGWGEALDWFGDPIDSVLSVEHRTLRPLIVA
jgi:hypothetical protein